MSYSIEAHFDNLRSSTAHFHAFQACYTVRVIIKYSPNARTHGYRYGRPTNARTGVRGKRVRASDRF